MFINPPAWIERKIALPSVTSSPGIAARLSASDLSILQRWAQSQPQAQLQAQATAPALASDHLQLRHNSGGIPTSAVRLPALPQQQLGPGARGPAVEQVQQRLNLWGYQTKVDGDFGPKTLRQVSRFQQNQGLPASGRVEPATFAALQRTPQQAQLSPVVAAPAAISLASLRSGQAQLSEGATGPAVEQVQQRLKLWGYELGKVDGDYGPRTTSAVKRFQAERKIQVNGRVGAQTLAALEQTPVSVGRLQSSSEAQKLASVAQRVAARRGTVGWCYAGVADSVSRALGVELYGRSAYQASNILARHPDFKEVPTVKPKELPKLPAGAIVVWGKTKASPHGHISVALGNGREASDHIARQMTSLRGHTNFRVFMPVA